MAEALSIMGDLFVSPARAFSALRDRPRWVLAATVISLCSTTLALLLIPYSLEILSQMLRDRFDAQTLRRVVAGIRSFSLLGAVATPAVLIAKWLLVSGIFSSLAVLLTARPVRFGSVLSVIVHAELILLLMGLVNLAILALRGPDTIRSAADLCAIPGLLTVVHSTPLPQPLITLLANANPFTVWYLVLLSMGLSTVMEVPRWKSGLAVLTVWVIMLGWTIAFSRAAETASLP